MCHMGAFIFDCADVMMPLIIVWGWVAYDCYCTDLQRACDDHVHATTSKDVLATVSLFHCADYARAF